MNKRLPRRSFLKIAAGAGVATGLGRVAREVILEPYVRPPEEVLPGVATWYASTCRQCSAGCGIIVRVINGRPRKIEGNPSHPLNRGKLCARGQAGLQALYNPDRLRNAVKQTGGRGSRRFEPIQWGEALDELTRVISGNNGERIAFLGGMIPDHLNSIVSLFLDSLGAKPPIIFDLHTALEGRFLIAEMANRWFGTSQVPTYDIARAEVILSFGANFLETWMSPVAQSVDYGEMRQGQAGGRGYFIQFEPRLSATAACADEWIPIQPGTEGSIALGIGRIIVEENLGRVGSYREFANLYRDVNVRLVAETSGLPVEQLQHLARIFANADRPVAIPGGYPSGHSNAPNALDAVMALNVIMRRLGREGGVFFTPQAPNEKFTSLVTPSSYEDLNQLIERMQDGDVEILFIHGANPVYELPVQSGFAAALENVPLVISFSPFVDETAVQADFILPDHTYLEAWGSQTIDSGVDRPAVGSQQPVAQPLYDTRSTADFFLILASKIGSQVKANLPWSDEVAYLEESSAKLIDSPISIYNARTAEGFWSRWRQMGGWWSENPIRKEPEVSKSLATQLEVDTPEFFGDPGLYPYYLMPYESLTLSDGRGASQPWLQETPDPMTTAYWNTWVEIHPVTAEHLGIDDNDVVRVRSPFGELEAPAVLYPGIRPDVIAIPTGQGHMDLGRFAIDRGENVMKLISPTPGGAAGQITWGATRVNVEPIGKVKQIARLESLDGEGRESLR